MIQSIFAAFARPAVKTAPAPAVASAAARVPAPPQSANRNGVPSKPRIAAPNRRLPNPITIGPNRIGLVATASIATILRELTHAADPALTIALGSLAHQAPGGTNYTAGIRTALDLLERAPAGYARHVYLIADGADTDERDGLEKEVARARRLGVRIYAIPIGVRQAGHSFDLKRLAWIAKSTGGKLRSVRNLKEMEQSYAELAALGGRNLGQAVAKVLVCDVSGSMHEAWDRTTKLGAAQFAIARFLSIESKRN